jgi:hypothetical protein
VTSQTFPEPALAQIRILNSVEPMHKNLSAPENRLQVLAFNPLHLCYHFIDPHSLHAEPDQNFYANQDPVFKINAGPNSNPGKTNFS